MLTGPPAGEGTDIPSDVPQMVALPSEGWSASGSQTRSHCCRGCVPSHACFGKETGCSGKDKSTKRMWVCPPGVRVVSVGRTAWAVYQGHIKRGGRVPRRSLRGPFVFGASASCQAWGRVFHTSSRRLLIRARCLSSLLA